MAVPKKSMKAMRSAKRISKIARGKLAKSQVFKGRREKTSGGLTKDALMKNKRGKIVSKRASANGKRSYKQIEPWVESLMEEREVLHTKGFVAVNGRTLQGKALYVKAKQLLGNRRQ